MISKTYAPLSVLLLMLITLPGCWNVCGERKQAQEVRQEVRTEQAQANVPAQQQEQPVAHARAAGVQEVKNLEEFNAVLKQGRPVIADFFAPWCGPCKRMKPIFETLAKKYPDIAFVTLNNDDSSTQGVFKKYNVNAFPTFIFIDASGNVVKTQSGGASESDFDATIAGVFKKAGNP